MNLTLLLLNSHGNTLWVAAEALARTRAGHVVALLRMPGSRGVARAE